MVGIVYKKTMVEIQVKGLKKTKYRTTNMYTTTTRANWYSGKIKLFSPFLASVEDLEIMMDTRQHK